MKLMVLKQGGQEIGSLVLEDGEWRVEDGEVEWVLEMMPRTPEAPSPTDQPRAWARAITPYANGYMKVRLIEDNGERDDGKRMFYAPKHDHWERDERGRFAETGGGGMGGGEPSAAQMFADYQQQYGLISEQQPPPPDPSTAVNPLIAAPDTPTHELPGGPEKEPGASVWDDFSLDDPEPEILGYLEDPTADHDGPDSRELDMFESRQFQQEHAQRLIPDMNRHQQKAMDSYKGAGYVDVNNALRGKDEPLVNYMTERGRDKTIERLDSVFEHEAAEVVEDVKVFRGMHSMAAAELGEDIVGETLVDDGFMSTSLSEAHAEYFAGGGVVLEVNLQAGDKAIPLDELTVGGADEDEMLLPRGTELRVDAVEMQGAMVKKVVAHVEPSATKAAAPEVFFGGDDEADDEVARVAEMPPPEDRTDYWVSQPGDMRLRKPTNNAE